MQYSGHICTVEVFAVYLKRFYLKIWSWECHQHDFTGVSPATSVRRYQALWVSETGWDLGAFATVLQCLCTDKPLLQQQNTKKLHETKNNCSWDKLWTKDCCKDCCCCLASSVLSDSCVTPWTVACQAPLSMGSPRQEYWSGSPFPSPGDLLDPGIEPTSPALQVDSLPSEPSSNPTLSFWAVLHQRQTQDKLLILGLRRF